MTRLAKSGLLIASTEGLGERFRHRGWIRLRRFLDPEFLHWARQTAEEEAFRRIDTKLGWELSTEDGRLKGVLEFLLNDERLFSAVRGIAGCRPIGCVAGRVYRFAPGSRE